MKDVLELNQSCSVCGRNTNVSTLVDSNQTGYPDLDFRPSGKYRNTMESWVSECPKCGYVASNLEDKLEISKDFLKSKEYLTCDGINFKSDLSKRFYKHYMIASKKYDYSEAYYAMVNCIWSCDDAKDFKNAKITRQIAIKLANKILEYDEKANKIIIMKADFLRRIGEFDQLIKEYENYTWVIH